MAHRFSDWVPSQSTSHPPGEPTDRENQGDRGRAVDAESLDELDRAFSEKVGPQPKNEREGEGACSVPEGKSGQAHAEQPGRRRGDNLQPGQEAGEEYRLAPMLFEKGLSPTEELVGALRDPGSSEEPASAETRDDEPCVAADEDAGRSHGNNARDRKMPAGGENRGRHQSRLARRSGYARRLDGDDREQDHEAVAL